MNLYKITFTHYAPKDSQEGIFEYLIAENEDEVYNYIDEKYNYGGWKDAEADLEPTDVFDEDYNKIGTETFREKIMRLKGRQDDEDYDFSDSYYGITLCGWDIVKEGVEIDDFTNAIELEIIRTIT